MITEIHHPEWLTLDVGGQTVLGYNQEWYPQERQRLAGCGPTVAAMMAAYLEKKEWKTPVKDRELALSVMLSLWQYATPRMHGLYKTRWLKEGLAAYLSEEGLSGVVESLSIPSIRLLAPKPERVISFIKAGLSADCPVGFLNLHSGSEPIPYHWHWMPIVAMEETEEGTFCTLWDEGKAHRFCLESWLKNTRFGGGFVRVTGA